MDLVLLRSLLGVADAGSITGAAERLHVSQSALSRRLQQLEADVGATLLVRGRHGVLLTEEGRLAVEEGRGIVARYERIRRDIVDRQHLVRGVVRVGGGATVTSYLLPSRIADFQVEHPGIRFYVQEAGSSVIAAAVVAGELELGIVTLPLAGVGLHMQRLYRDEITLVARADHPLAARGSVRTEELSGQPFVVFEHGSAIRELIDGMLRTAGVDVDVVMELRSIPTMLKMVSTTGGLAFVSGVSVPTEPGLRAIPVRGLTIVRTLALATRRDVPLSAPAAAFRSTLLDHLGPGLEQGP
jgi:DNA-binding transcriptional LysR family regulator